MLVGPSGCGKSTVAAHARRASRRSTPGAIRIGDRDVTDLQPKERDIAMVFQNYALYPHMTRGRQHGLRAQARRAWRRTDIRKRVAGGRARSSTSNEYLDRKPKALSGGQRQRVAMGRAIVRQPQVFLMDEPLSNLDAKLRVQTRTQIAALQHRLGVTTVYVTHDQVEAMTMGDRVAVLKDGLLQQVDTPHRALRPARERLRRRVHRLAGHEPRRPRRSPPTAPRSAASRSRCPAAPWPSSARRTPRTVTLGFRPESVELVGEGQGFPMTVDVVEELGSDAFVYGRLGVDQGEMKPTDTRTIVRVDPRKPPAVGEVVYLRIRENESHIFSPATGARLGD